MLNSVLIGLNIRFFNNYGDTLVTDIGVIRFKGYRCINGKYRKAYSVAKSTKIANCGGYTVKGLMKRAFVSL